MAFLESKAGVLQLSWTQQRPIAQHVGRVDDVTFGLRVTFGALVRNHIVSTVFETIAKEKNENNRKKEGLLSTCDQQCIMIVKNTTEVRTRMLCEKKQDLTSMAVQKKDINNRTQITRTGFISITVLIIQKNIRITLRFYKIRKCWTKMQT